MVSDTVRQPPFAADTPPAQADYVDAGGNDYNGRYVKQVTVVVHDPRNPAKILARQTSLFNPFD